MATPRNLRMAPPSGARERYVAVFMLGLALFFPPLLVVFDMPGLTWGIPSLFLYLYSAWAVVILLIAAIAQATSHAEKEIPEPVEQDTKP